MGITFFSRHMVYLRHAHLFHSFHAAVLLVNPLVELLTVYKNFTSVVAYTNKRVKVTAIYYPCKRSHSYADVKGGFVFTKQTLFAQYIHVIVFWFKRSHKFSSFPIWIFYDTVRERQVIDSAGVPQLYIYINFIQQLYSN